MPTHAEDIHKYSRGKVISVAGSSGYVGACILAVNAALSVGGGIVKVIVPESLKNIYETSLTEAIMVSVYDRDEGFFIKEHVDRMLTEILWADGVLFGPGLHNDSIAVEWMIEVLKNITKPLILDASGFLSLSDYIS